MQTWDLKCESMGQRVNAWDVFRPTPCRGGHGRRAVVRFVACCGCGGTFFVLCLFILFSSKAHGPLQV